MVYHLTTLREAPDGARTLCLTPLRNEERLGDALTPDPWLEEAIAPLVARFAALVFTEDARMVEPLLQQLRWVAYEYGLDHIVLPLWPESRLAHQIQMMATDLGLPHQFVLTQDETTWPLYAGIYAEQTQAVVA